MIEPFDKESSRLLLVDETRFLISSVAILLLLISESVLVIAWTKSKLVPENRVFISAFGLLHTVWHVGLLLS